MNELRERKFPSLAKEGCREAAGWFDQEIDHLTNTTPALRATPPLLRRGISLVCLFIHTFYDRAYRQKPTVMVSPVCYCTQRGGEFRSCFSPSVTKKRENGIFHVFCDFALSAFAIARFEGSMPRPTVIETGQFAILHGGLCGVTQYFCNSLLR